MTALFRSPLVFFVVAGLFLFAAVRAIEDPADGDRGGDAAIVVGREALLDFYGLHYSAERMALAVLGAAPLDELEAAARTSFAGVPPSPRAPSRGSADALVAAAEEVAAAGAAGRAILNLWRGHTRIRRDCKSARRAWWCSAVAR